MGRIKRKGTATRARSSSGARDPRARREYVDTASGAPVEPGPPGSKDGAAPTGRIVAEVEGVRVEVDPEDVVAAEGEHPRLQRFDYAARGGVVDYEARAAEARAELDAAEGRRARGPRFRETFSSPREAAETFYNENAAFFDHVRDPVDGVREWMDGVEVRSGKRFRKLYDTPRGAEILARANRPRSMIIDALAYVFGQARGRRWDAVDWDQIERLEVALIEYYEAPVGDEAAVRGVYWRPVFGRPTIEQLEELSPDEQAAVLEQEAAAEVRAALEELRESYAENRGCLTPGARVVVERRIAEWERWAEDPSQIPAYACEPDERTGGYTCNYPAVAGELRAVARACRDGYDPAWAEPEARGGALGYPDLRGAPLDEPPRELETVQAREEQREGLRQLAEGGRAFGAARPAVVETVTIGAVLYQLELVKCGRTCWCSSSWPAEGHGPYWYAYFIVDGVRKSKYIGRGFREIG